MPKRLIPVGTAVLSVMLGTAIYAWSQSAGVLWPQNLPANTVIGRIGAGQAGPAEAIPFATLFSQFTALSATANQVFAGPASGGAAPAAFRSLVVCRY